MESEPLCAVITEPHTPIDVPPNVLALMLRTMVDVMLIQSFAAGLLVLNALKVNDASITLTIIAIPIEAVLTAQGFA